MPGTWPGQVSQFTKWAGMQMEQEGAKVLYPRPQPPLFARIIFFKQIRYWEFFSSHNYAGKLLADCLPTARWRTRCTPQQRAEHYRAPPCQTATSGKGWRGGRLKQLAQERWGEPLDSVPILTPALATSSLLPPLSTTPPAQLRLSLPTPDHRFLPTLPTLLPPAPKKQLHHL